MLKDAEVERLERAGRAASGSISRAECLESMYGRIDPKPRGTFAPLGIQVAPEASLVCIHPLYRRIYLPSCLALSRSQVVKTHKTHKPLDAKSLNTPMESCY